MERIIATFNAYNEDEVKLYSNAAKYRNALIDIDELIRKALKYGHEFKTADDALQGIRDEIRLSVDASFWD